MPDDQPILELETAGLIPDSNGDNHGKDPDEEGAILIKKLEQREKRFVYSERLIILGSLVVLCLAILIVYVFASHTAGKLALAHRGRSRHDKEHLSLSAFGGLIGTLATNYFLKK
jgi:hypothetical protein